ncbi:hypothetical protein F5X99DRAFT_407987 [Biscogniauxia marginata]|nr:hypothetical protein F5X99DRAFT_407987 [Biscogniauxia marginata]
MQQYEGIWRKRQLLPSWILQILCSLVLGAIAIVLLVAASYVESHAGEFDRDSDRYYYGYDASQLADYANATGGVVLALAAATLVLDVAEIVLYKRRRLAPALLLASACLKTLVWGAWFVLSVVAAAAGSVGVVDLVFGFVLAGTSIVQLVFGAIYTHRKRRGTLRPRGDAKTAGVEAGYGY